MFNNYFGSKNTFYTIVKVLILFSGIVFTFFIVFFKTLTSESFIQSLPDSPLTNVLKVLLSGFGFVYEDNPARGAHVLFALMYLCITFVCVVIFPGRSVLEIALLFFTF